MDLEKIAKLHETQSIDEVNSYLKNGDWYLVSAYPKKVSDDFKMFYILGYMNYKRNGITLGEEKTRELLSSLATEETTFEEEVRKKELLELIKKHKK